MLPISVVDAIKNAGYELERLDRGLARTFDIHEIDHRAIPAQIINEIKDTPLRGNISISDTYILGDRILRCQNLTFNPNSTLNWKIQDGLSSSDFVVIATKRLVINFPNPDQEPSHFKISAPVEKAHLKGRHGEAGPTGWSSGQDDGRSGGQGGPGETGEAGKTYNFPMLYIFYQDIELHKEIPSGPIGLRIIGQGVDGGDGGRGGQGGIGGHGARGTPGKRECALACWCSAGPGDGGNGGKGGAGGRGGNAGKGGNGISIFAVGPRTEIAKLDQSEVILVGGAAGNPGKAGSVGLGGKEGGGGSKPFECVDGGKSGIWGPEGDQNLGDGHESPDGLEGAFLAADRNNSDLF